MLFARSNVGWERAGGMGRGESPPNHDSSSLDWRLTLSDMILETGVGSRLYVWVDVDGR